jgi:hypothetical protein
MLKRDLDKYMERAESLKQELDISHAAEQDLNSQLEAAKKVPVWTVFFCKIGRDILF